MRTVLALAIDIEVQCVFGQFETMFFRDGMLASFDFLIEKLFNVPALQTEQMVVMAAPVEFVNRLVIVEVMPDQNAGMLELGQHPIHGGQSHIHAIGKQETIDIVGGQMTLIGLFEQGKNFHARSGDFQSQGLELISTGHDGGRLGVAY